MGFSSSKSKTKNEPWAPAQPYILEGLKNTQDVFDAQQPRLNQMSGIAQDAYNAIAPGAFGSNSMVQNAQKVAQGIAGGKTDYSGNATMQRLSQGGAMPSQGFTANLLNGGYNNPANSYDGAVAGGQYLGSNPGAGAYADTMSGKYMGQNPGAGFYADTVAGKLNGGNPGSRLYSDTIAGKYLDNNPYVDAIAGASADRAARGVNARFAASGMGEGMSTPYADVFSRNVTEAGNQVRYANYASERDRQMQAGAAADSNYQNDRARQLQAAGMSDAAYGDERNRMLSAAGAADGAFQNERGRMDAANSRIGDDYRNSISARMQAGSLADQSLLSSQNQQLSAAGALNETERQDRMQQLTALGLIPGLREAEYAGVGPALGLLSASAEIPWYGVGAYNGNIRQASNGYGTSTTKSSVPWGPAAGSFISDMASIFAPGGK